LSVVAIVQARMGSERLRGKVMKEVAGQPLLGHLLDRLRAVDLFDRIVVATTDQPADERIVELAEQHGVCSFRGSEQDVLGRYYEAACDHSAAVVVRITADNPLLDPLVVEQVILHFLAEQSDFDYVSNGGEGSGFAHGMYVEVFSMDALERAHLDSTDRDEREHVGLYFRRRPELFRLGRFQYRLTVDTREDLELTEKIFDALYDENPLFTLQDIYSLLRRHPEWVHINAHVGQVQA